MFEAEAEAKSSRPRPKWPRGLTCNITADNLYCVGGDVKPGSLTQSVKCVSDTGRPRSGK